MPNTTPDRSRNVRTAMERHALRGLVLGRLPYGYEAAGDGSIQPAQGEADMVRRIFELAAEGKGVRAIAKHLNESGSRTRRGGHWSMVTIRDMLRNRTYVGVYQRFSSRVTNNHEPLVTPETFTRIQRQLDERAAKSGSARGRPFLLSGAVTCAACGSHMIGVSRRRSWTRKDGSMGDRTYRYYQCEGAANQGRCSSRGYPAGDLDAQVLSAVRTAEGSSREGVRQAVEDNLAQASADEERMRALQQTVRDSIKSVTVGLGSAGAVRIELSQPAP